MLLRSNIASSNIIVPLPVALTPGLMLAREACLAGKKVCLWSPQQAHEHAVLLSMQDAKMVPRGLEPRTLRLLAVRSNQLSYETSCKVNPEQLHMCGAHDECLIVTMLKQSS